MCEGRTCASSPSQMNAAFSKDYFKNHSFNLIFLSTCTILSFDFSVNFEIWNAHLILKNGFVTRKNHFSIFKHGFFMKKMAVQISKMVLSREKRAFQISMVFFHEKKGFLIFETDFRHSVFRLPWNKMKRFQLKNSPK